MPSKYFAITLAIALVAGCHTTTVPDQLLPKFAGNEPDTQLDFWHHLATRSLVSNDEAFHGMLLYLDGKDDAQGFAQRTQTLKSRRLIPANFNRPADEALQRGTLAYSIARTLNIKGGLTVRLTGLSPRYAIRELEYLDILPTSSTNQVFTGREFVGVIGKAQDYRDGDPTNAPANVLPSQTRAAVAAQKSGKPMLQLAPDISDEITPILAMIAPDPGTLALATTGPASTQAAGRKVVVTGVEGLASVRADEASPWKPATKGMELTEKAEFRTGPTGAIQFVIPPDQTVSVDRLTQLKVLKAIQEGGKVTTDLGIKYGRTRYDLEGGGLEHQSTLRSPNATLAVRGTKVSLFDQAPFTPQATSLTGRAQFQAMRRQMIAFGGPGAGKMRVDADSDSPGEATLSESVIDPTLDGARSSSEAELVTTVISRGSFVEIDRSSGIKIVRGGTPPTDSELLPALPGRLNFVLRWNGDANLDLGVATPDTEATPGGEFVYPQLGLNIAPSGGRTAFDHRGGANGGIEVVYFNKFDDGIYNIGGRHAAGATVQATVDVFLDGSKIDVSDGVNVGKTITQTVDATRPALAFTSVGAELPPPPPPPSPAPKKATKTAKVSPAAPVIKPAAKKKR